jgi:hypothetical protein
VTDIIIIFKQHIYATLGSQSTGNRTSRLIRILTKSALCTYEVRNVSVICGKIAVSEMGLKSDSPETGILRELG